jgi:subtilase family serine protease
MKISKLGLTLFLLGLYPASYAQQTYGIQGYIPADWEAHPPYHIINKRLDNAFAALTPALMIQAYHFPKNGGAGQVIAIVDAYDDPNVEADLAVFSTTYNLPACTTANGCFTKIFASGTQPAGNTSWGTEIALDVEWAHAMAPLAKIILVEAADSSYGLYNAITVAINNHATVISCSWGGDEYNGENSLDYIFQKSPVPILVASGDKGHAVEYPAASPYVVSVGGNNITIDANGNYQSEIAWNGSSGGISSYEAEPAYQINFPLPQNTTKGRGVPDISYNAGTGVPIYDTYGQNGWMTVGGTSAGTPQWAALIAIANAQAGKVIQSVNNLLYTAATTSYSSLFHDITTGTNGSCGYLCQASVGYDYVTGLGSPQAQNLINYLANPSGTCVLANPTVSLSPSSQTGVAGGTVTYAVTVNNNNATACAASKYNLASIIPAGLTGSLDTSTLTLGSGAKGAASLKLTSSSTLPAATYAINASATDATNPAITANATAKYITTSSCVYVAPTVIVSPSSQSTSGTAPSVYNFSLTNNHSAACSWGLFRFSRNTDDNNLVITASTNGELLLPGQTYNGTITVTPNTSAKVGAHSLNLTTDVQSGWSTVVTPFALNYSTQATCVHANPLVTLLPASQNGPSGGTVSYSIAITNKDSASCTASTFNLTPTVPSSLTSVLSATTVNLAPNATATATLKLTSATTSPAANYTVSTKVVNASDASLSNIATAQYVTTSSCVYSPPTILIAPSSQNTTGVNPANYTFSIKNNNSDACSWGLFRFSRQTDDYNLVMTMSTNGELLLPGTTYTGSITATPNTSTKVGMHNLSIFTNLQNGSQLENKFSLGYSKTLR